ncbi:MAG TPA: aminotransferase class I/II-fold pyridoxal phosphate-dependent enzyme [Actinomycetales bacterium]|nr:aminotransferase class I/II-fold pyridoxal phosphate-dependent enzyme [Actinomycetales bacterium]
MIEDLSDEQLRARDSVKWDVAEPGVLPAWVAETDYALDPHITAALQQALRDEVVGYPAPKPGARLAVAFTGFAARNWGWETDPGRVVLAGDVMAGVRLVLETLCEKAPVVVPTPAYPPFLDVAQVTGRPLVQVPLDADARDAVLDLERIEAQLTAGARTVILCNPHNPWGRAFTRPELEGLRDIVTRYGARVISDEIHAPLVLPGAEHVPYLTIDGTADHATTVLSASKAWNVPGLKCAQIVAGNDADAAALNGVPLVANHGVSPLGIVANTAAFNEGEPWLKAFIARIDEQRSLLHELVATHLPAARMRPIEATYLAWLDLRAYGYDEPAGVCLERADVMLNEGTAFGEGGAGHVRVTLATSPERLTEVVRRLARALKPH